MNENFAFLKSNRFWVSVIGAVALYLKTRGWIGEPEAVMIATICGLFITVRTVDRLGETA